MKHCTCGAVLDFSHQYDAAFCRLCDAWRETNCGSPTCEFCARRPERPLMATDLDAASEAPFNPPRLRPDGEQE